MIFLKKYITFLLLLLLCTPSLDAMAQKSNRNKSHKSARQTEVIKKDKKSESPKKDKHATVDKSKTDKKTKKSESSKTTKVVKSKKNNKSAKPEKSRATSKQRSSKTIEAEPITVIQSVPVMQAADIAKTLLTEEPKQVELTPKTLTRLEKIQQRGITDMSNTFISKGSWIGGAGASYSQHINDNYNIAIIEGIVSEGYTFNVSAMGAYALRNNMAIGLRATYNRSNLTLDNSGLKFGDDDTGTEISVNNYKAVRHSYNVAAIWRQYIPLGQSKRFAIFNEISLGAGGLQSIYASGQPIKGTYEEGYTISLGVSPGLMAFATNDIAIEVNVGVMGINFSDVKQVHNQIYDGNRRSSSMNFNVNLLSIGVGVSFYL